MARSGRFSKVSDLKKSLAKEGYLPGQIEGRALRRQLADLIRLGTSYLAETRPASPNTAASSVDKVAGREDRARCLQLTAT